jgi:5-methylcytosine-specific restriction protein A
MPRRVPTYRPPSLGPAQTDRHREYNRFGRDPFLLELYSTGRWKKFRAWIRTSRILCERCKAEGRTTAGEQVHHKISPRVDMSLAFEPTNCELLCHACHSRETASGTKRQRE